MWATIFLAALLAICLAIWVIIEGIIAWEQTRKVAALSGNDEKLKFCEYNQALGFAMLWVLSGLGFVCAVGAYLSW